MNQSPFPKKTLDEELDESLSDYEELAGFVENFLNDQYPNPRNKGCEHGRDDECLLCVKDWFTRALYGS